MDRDTCIHHWFELSSHSTFTFPPPPRKKSLFKSTFPARFLIPITCQIKFIALKTDSIWVFELADPIIDLQIGLVCLHLSDVVLFVSTRCSGSSDLHHDQKQSTHGLHISNGTLDLPRPLPHTPSMRFPCLAGCQEYSTHLELGRRLAFQSSLCVPGPNMHQEAAGVCSSKRNRLLSAAAV